MVEIEEVNYLCPILTHKKECGYEYVTKQIHGLCAHADYVFALCTDTSCMLMYCVCLCVKSVYVFMLCIVFCIVYAIIMKKKRRGKRRAPRRMKTRHMRAACLQACVMLGIGASSRTYRSAGDKCHRNRHHEVV